KTTINTVNVPKLFVSQKLPEIRYSQPGELSINVKRMCGDGDVAHHEQANPNFKYVAQDQDSVTAILGSWIVKEGESVLPSVENWIPIGYTELEVPMWPAAQVPVPEDQAYRYEVEWIKNAGQFRLVNGLSPDPTNKEIDGLTVLSDNIPKLMDFAKQRMDKTNKYRIYS